VRGEETRPQPQQACHAPRDRERGEDEDAGDVRTQGGERKRADRCGDEDVERQAGDVVDGATLDEVFVVGPRQHQLNGETTNDGEREERETVEEIRSEGLGDRS
jgi:hypothetical protein